MTTAKQKKDSSSSEASVSGKYANDSAERALLGSIIMEPELMGLAAQRLRPFKDEAFYMPEHRPVWAGCLALYDGEVAIDPIALKQWLIGNGKLDEVGGLSGIVDLTSHGSPARFNTYLDLCIEAAAYRVFQSAATAALEKGVVAPGETISHITKARNAIDDVLALCRRRTIQSASVADCKDEMLTELAKVMEGEARLRDIDTCIESIDRITDGLGRGDLSIIAARPSIGKTALACNIAVSNALIGRHVIFYSFEMSRKQILMRLASIAGSADPRRLHGPYGKTEYAKLEQAMADLAGTQLYVAEQLKPIIEDVEQSLKEHVLRYGNPDIIIVDYLQLMRSARRSENRNLEIGLITGTLKSLARAYDCQVVSLSQLKRADNNRPNLEDLRDSGNIEQDADVVMLMSYSNHVSRTEIVLNVDVAKNRPGATGTTQIKFKTPYQQMRDLGTGTPEEG